jgi:hypothetical protein
MAKNNKPAQAYDEPHKMSGEKTNTSTYSGYEPGAKVLEKLTSLLVVLAKVTMLKKTHTALA